MRTSFLGPTCKMQQLRFLVSSVVVGSLWRTMLTIDCIIEQYPQERIPGAVQPFESHGASHRIVATRDVDLWRAVSASGLAFSPLCAHAYP